MKYRLIAFIILAQSLANADSETDKEMINTLFHHDQPWVKNGWNITLKDFNFKTFNFKNWTEIQNFFQIEIDKIEIIGRSFKCGISSYESRKVSNYYNRRWCWWQMLGDRN